MTEVSIEVNGAMRSVPVDTTLLALIESAAGTTRGSALVVDGLVVPRSQWGAMVVAPGQRVELITAVQGG
jgi:sulfur carrier protein